MPNQITSGASTITPTTIDGYTSKRAAQSILHPIIGRTNGSPDVTLRPAAMRNGTLTLGFAGASSEADSKTAADLLAGASTFALVSTERPSVPMTFVVQGDVARDLEPETRNAWLVTFDYQEVA